jgi:V-type ATPase, D subunit
LQLTQSIIKGGENLATVNATRMELTRLKGKLITATRGHKLLKDKRDELMREFLDLVRKNKALREKVEEDLKNANKNFVIARSTMSDETVRVAFMAPKQELTVEVNTRNVMSVNIPQFETKTRTSDEGDIYSYGFAFTSSDLDTAVLSLSNIQKDLITLAEVEKSCSLMAAEIEKTRRRVNALEYVMIPTLQANIKMITMKLDENERSTQIRLMKVKDMMLEETHHYKEKQEILFNRITEE